MLDPDFIEIGASGRAWTRPEMIEALLADPDGTTDATRFKSTLLSPDLVLLRYETPRARRTSLWHRADGEWRVLHHQGTPYAPE